MSFKKYEEGCPGCRPVVLDSRTMKALPVDHPLMVAVNEVWKTTTREERAAFHDFTCCNIHNAHTLSVISQLNHRIELAVKATSN